MHDPLVEWVPKNAKSGAEEQENAMARDAMATIEGNLTLPGCFQVIRQYDSKVVTPKAPDLVAVACLPLLDMLPYWCVRFVCVR